MYIVVRRSRRSCTKRPAAPAILVRFSQSHKGMLYTTIHPVLCSNRHWARCLSFIKPLPLPRSAFVVQSGRVGSVPPTAKPTEAGTGVFGAVTCPPRFQSEPWTAGTRKAIVFGYASHAHSDLALHLFCLGRFYFAGKRLGHPSWRSGPVWYLTTLGRL